MSDISAIGAVGKIEQKSVPLADVSDPSGYTALTAQEVDRSVKAIIDDALEFKGSKNDDPVGRESLRGASVVVDEEKSMLVSKTPEVPTESEVKQDRAIQMISSVYNEASHFMMATVVSRRVQQDANHIIKGQ
jgi:hypothetical protein